MKRNYVYAINFALVWTVVLTGFVAVFSQRTIGTASPFAQELRPFDFSDKYYYANGVQPELIVNRRNGADGQSVADSINDSRFRGVRILSVFPAYNQDGKIFYFNLYGELFEESFRRDDVGKQALERADFYPLYVFPSINNENEFRQAHLINLRDEGYFEKNPLGLSVQVLIEFTDRIYTKDGQLEMAALAERNGASGDGTPIIKTVDEIEGLTQKNYITQKIKGLDNPSVPSFAISKALQNPQGGAIAPDAFLLNPLGVKADQSFVRNFECLQIEGKWCGR